MCTGRVDLALVLRAFQKGADGVIIGGCWPGECHYVTEGNYEALCTTHLGRKLLDRELRKIGTTLRRLSGSEDLRQLLTSHGLSKEDDLLAAIGFGNISSIRPNGAAKPPSHRGVRRWCAVQDR